MLASILEGMRVLHQQVADVRSMRAEVSVQNADIERQIKRLEARIARLR